MSTNIVNFICSAIMSTMGLIVVRKISGSKEKVLTLKSVLLMIMLIILPIVIRNPKYSYVYTMSIYAITVIVYKYILNINLTKSIISCGVLLTFTISLDLIVSSISMVFLSLDQLRNVWYINIMSNLTVFALMLIIFQNKFILSKIRHFVNKTENYKAINYIIFFILTTIAMSTTVYIISLNYELNNIFTIAVMTITIFFILTIILINERYSYDKLYAEYDNLFKYVKVFEDWIETEQLNRHEYKNQLAVLRCMTNEKKVKEKIDSIISDNINVDNEMVYEFKNLPNGGFKGLLYYKIIIARNNKINLEIDIDSTSGKMLSKLHGDKLKIISNLIGIYLDNAIEASKETKKKIVSVEIYKNKTNVNIVISNTYNSSKDISNRYKKGISTKGAGRGNGLYFANKLIAKNNWIKEEQEIINSFYIQKLIIDINKKN